jgi:uncharacterized membrane protein
MIAIILKLSEEVFEGIIILIFLVIVYAALLKLKRNKASKKQPQQRNNWNAILNQRIHEQEIQEQKKQNRETEWELQLYLE